MHRALNLWRKAAITFLEFRLAITVLDEAEELDRHRRTLADEAHRHEIAVAGYRRKARDLEQRIRAIDTGKPTLITLGDH